MDKRLGNPKKNSTAGGDGTGTITTNTNSTHDTNHGGTESHECNVNKLCCKYSPIHRMVSQPPQAPGVVWPRRQIEQTNPTQRSLQTEAQDSEVYSWQSSTPNEDCLEVKVFLCNHIQHRVLAIQCSNSAADTLRLHMLCHSSGSIVISKVSAVLESIVAVRERKADRF